MCKLFLRISTEVLAPAFNARGSLFLADSLRTLFLRVSPEVLAPGVLSLESNSVDADSSVVSFSFNPRRDVDNDADVETDVEADLSVVPLVLQDSFRQQWLFSGERNRMDGMSSSRLGSARQDSLPLPAKDFTFRRKPGEGFSAFLAVVYRFSSSGEYDGLGPSPGVVGAPQDALAFPCLPPPSVVEASFFLLLFVVGRVLVELRAFSSAV